MKKLLCLCLAVVMIGSLFAGCQSGNNNGGKSANGDLITITIAGPSGPTVADWTNSLQFEAYREKLGLDFQAKTYTNEQWASKVTLIMANDEMPDMLCMNRSAMTRADVQRYADDGYLLDFSQYLDIMPNLKATMELYPEYADNITFEDGHIWGLSNMNTGRFVYNGKATSTPYTLINGSWLEAVGMDVPTTLDEFYEVLKAFKEQDPNGNGEADEIPWAYTTMNKSGENRIKSGFGLFGNASIFNLNVDENGTIYVNETTENYKQFLTYMHKLYSEGLINQDMFITNTGTITEWAKNNQVGYISDTADVVLQKELQDQMQWTQLEPMVDVTGVPTMVSDTLIETKFDIVVNANTEHPEEICKFIDYLYTPEGSLSGRNGYEGITFTWKEIAGYKIADHTEMALEYDYANPEEFRQKKAMAEGAFALVGYPEGTIYDMLCNVDEAELTNTDGEVWASSTVNALVALAYRNEDLVVLYPFVEPPFTAEENEERSILVTDVKNYMQTMKAQFITGEKSIENDWDEYLAELERMGLSRLLEITQTAYDRQHK